MGEYTPKQRPGNTQTVANKKSWVKSHPSTWKAWQVKVGSLSSAKDPKTPTESLFELWFSSSRNLSISWRGVRSHPQKITQTTNNQVVAFLKCLFHLEFSCIWKKPTKTHHITSTNHTSLSRPKALLKPFWEMNRSRCISIERVTWSIAPPAGSWISSLACFSSFQEWSITHFWQKASLDWTFPKKNAHRNATEMGEKVCWFLPNQCARLFINSVISPLMGNPYCEFLRFGLMN